MRPDSRPKTVALRALPNQPRVVQVPLAALLPADSPRLAGEDLSHARALADADAALPPILVHRQTMRIVDGMHRYRAALLRGIENIDVVFVDGTNEDVFLLAVKANTTHGLPLSTADREAAVNRVLQSHPDWSDRAIAAATGLGTRLIKAVRQSSAEISAHSDTRVGRDGRARPLNGAEGRRRVAEEILAHPAASLRDIAGAAGVSLATARDVRERLRQGKDPLPPSQREAERRAGDALFPGRRGTHGSRLDWAAVRENMARDPALKYSEAGRWLLRWLDTHHVDAEQMARLGETVPPHWSGAVTDVAKEMADKWLALVKALESRTKGR